MVPVPYFPGAILITIIFLCFIFKVPVGKILLRFLKKALGCIALLILFPITLPLTILCLLPEKHVDKLDAWVEQIRARRHR